MIFNRIFLAILFAASIAAEPCQPYSMITSDSFNPPCGDTFTTRLKNDVLTVFSQQPPCNYKSASPSVSYFLDSISLSNITSLEYNIRWNQPLTNCTFGIGDKTGFFLNMTDQLGLSNHPNEDLKGFSNGWYARRFVLDQQTLSNTGHSSGLRFGFICSRAASNETIFRNVDFNRIRVFRGESDKVGLDLMDPLQVCTGCIQPAPAFGMQCQMNDTVYRWVQNGDLRTSTLEIPFLSNVKVIGDVYSDYIYIYDGAQLNMTGCLKNMAGSNNYPIIVYVSGYYYTENLLTIYTGPNCPLPNIRISSASSMLRCPDFFSGTYYASGSDAIAFQWTRKINDACWDNENYEDDVDWRLILVIVLPCCALIAGVIIAIVFGVRKHKKRQMERQEKLEEMTRSGFTINPKNDIEK